MPARCATPRRSDWWHGSKFGRRELVGNILIGPEVTRWFSNGRVVFPRAEMLGKLAFGRNDFVSGDKLEPIYLRQANFVKAPPPRTL